MLQYPNFFRTQHCLSRFHCETCRSKIDGRIWRESIAKTFKVSVVDFACPYGNEWGIIKKETPRKSICKYMNDTGELKASCCGNYIVCQNPKSPIFIGSLPIKDGEIPRVWWQKKCRPEVCKFFTFDEGQNI
jgi:hypothetical protein